MTTSAESAWVLRQHRRRATPRSELAARLSERILAAPTHEQLLEQLVQENELELVESPRWSVANHTEVAISLAMEWKNRALELEHSLSEKIAQLHLARSRSAGSQEADRAPSPTPPAVGSPAIAAGTSISALTGHPFKRTSSAIDTAASPIVGAGVASPRWGPLPLGSPLVKRVKRVEEKAVQTSTVLSKDAATQSGNGEIHCLHCADLKKQLENERRRVLFFQNENRRLELREIRSPPMDDLEAFGAETIADQAQASIQPDYADVSYGAPHLVTQAPPTLSPALSVVPEGDEQEGGEMKQQLTEQLDVQLESKYEDLNISPPSDSNEPDVTESSNVGFISDPSSPPTPSTPPPSPAADVDVMPSDPEDADRPVAMAVAQETAAVVVQVAAFAAVEIEDEPPEMGEEEAEEMEVEIIDPQLRALNAAAAASGAEQKAPPPISFISTPQWAHARARAAGFTLPLRIDIHGQLLGWMSGGPEELQRAKQEAQRQREEERRQQTREEERKRGGEGMES